MHLLEVVGWKQHLLHLTSTSMLGSLHRDGKKPETNSFPSSKPKIELHVESLLRTSAFVDEVTNLALHMHSLAHPS
jgi:hypothetical protein